MDRMLRNEAGERLVEGYERTRNAAMIAEACRVSEGQVYKLAKQRRERGSTALRTSQRGRKRKMAEEMERKDTGTAENEAGISG